MYKSSIDRGGIKGRPPVSWVDRVNKHWRERVGRRGIKCLERECWNREVGDASAVATPLREVSMGGQGVRDADR